MTGPSGRDVRLALEAATMDIRGFVQLTRQIWCCLWRRGPSTTTTATSVVKETVTSQVAASSSVTCDVRQHHVQPSATDRPVLRAACIPPTTPAAPSPSTASSSPPSAAAVAAALDAGSSDLSTLPVTSIPHAGRRHTSAPRTPPTRLKSAGRGGLLERRGSNASLTLDLGALTTDSPTPPVGSPPAESSADEFLQSATHRMTRSELIEFLQNPLAVQEEFWKIPMNHPDKIIVPGSGVKNRYRTIIPNESTRVVLTSSQAADNSAPATSYINANYIRGYRGDSKSYIATQGPMTNTVVDFWTMVWQERASVIVMITKLAEQNRSKCECYMPECSALYGDILVHIESRHSSVRDQCVRRYLVLKNVRERGDVTHRLVHYWYSAWPDHQAPEAADQLIQLALDVERRRCDSGSGTSFGPVIVHCSAGIGRTGCFIATSIGIQQLLHEHSVDVLSTVCALRLDRGGMVQTSEQYEFVHYAISAFDPTRHVISRLTSSSSSMTSSPPVTSPDDDELDLK